MAGLILYIYSAIIEMSETRKLRLAKTFDIYNLHYKKPVKDDMAVCIVYFNSNKSKRILMNCLYVIEKLKLANIPYYVAEMYTDYPDIKEAFHYKTDIILFQKERLCHLMLEKVPAKYTKLMYIDGDIIFDNLNWYNEMSDKLDTYDAVHGFTKVLRLDITYKRVLDEVLSFTFRRKYGNTVHKVGKYKMGFAPGGAWGFKREWFNKIGFFENEILGGSDTYSVQSWGIVEDTYPYPEYIIDSIQDYKDKIKTPPRVGRLSGNIFHLWHGDSKRYKGNKSKKLIFKGVKDIRGVLSKTSNGLFTLKNRTLRKKFHKYFLNRDDDGVDEEDIRVIPK